MPLSHDDVMEALLSVTEPDLQQDLVSAKLVRDLDISDYALALTIALTTPATPHKERIRALVEGALRPLLGERKLYLTLQADAPQGRSKLPNVRHVLGVGAGKGGVVKSTVAVNLALSLAKAGAKVGLLDADVYGPSVPIMLGLKGHKPVVNADRKIVAFEAHGIRCISMGFLVGEDTAVAWRGPMVGRAVQQFVEDVDWGPLDYLIVDLPPGTGDVILSLCQALPLTGAVVVSTPQDVAFADVLRAVKMFGMLKVDVIGLVENMSFFHCPDNGKDYNIFGPSHSAEHCAQQEIEFLGQLPIDLALSANADAGRPIVAAEPEGLLAGKYKQIAGRVASKLAVLAFAAEKTEAAGDGFFGARPGA